MNARTRAEWRRSAWVRSQRSTSRSGRIAADAGQLGDAVRRRSRAAPWRRRRPPAASAIASTELTGRPAGAGRPCRRSSAWRAGAPNCRRNRPTARPRPPATPYSAADGRRAIDRPADGADASADQRLGGSLVGRIATSASRRDRLSSLLGDDEVDLDAGIGGAEAGGSAPAARSPTEIDRRHPQFAARLDVASGDAPLELQDRIRPSSRRARSFPRPPRSADSRRASVRTAAPRRRSRSPPGDGTPWND